jgi:hypothetical protein
MLAHRDAARTHRAFIARRAAILPPRDAKRPL